MADSTHRLLKDRSLPNETMSDDGGAQNAPCSEQPLGVDKPKIPFKFVAKPFPVRRQTRCSTDRLMQKPSTTKQNKKANLVFKRAVTNLCVCVYHNFFFTVSF